MSSILCTAAEFGIECQYSAVMTEPVALCGEHRIQLALLLVPEVLTEALRNAQTGLASRTVPEEERRALVAGARPVDTHDHLAGTHAPAVYFITNGSRVKIGTSTSLRNRVSSLSLRAADVLLLLRGGPVLERALHGEFADYRIANTEWFALAEPIESYIAMKNTELVEERKSLEERAETVRFLAERPKVEEETEVVDDPPAVEAGAVEMEPALPVVARGPFYPDRTPVLPKHRAAWEAFRVLGTATIDELKTIQLEGHSSRESCKTALKAFVAHEGAISEQDGRTERFHCLVGPDRRKEA